MTATTTRPKITGAVYEIPASLIEPDPNQPRKAFDPEHIQTLGQQIAAEGLRQPITVRANPEKPGHFLIVMGECRWRAHCHAGIQAVKCHVATDCEDFAKRFRAQVVENKGRRDMSLREDAFAAKQMTDNGDDDATVARTMCMSVYRMKNIRRMTALSEEVWNHIDAGHITPSIAEFAVGKLPDSHIESVLLRCVGKNRKQAAAIVCGVMTELSQSTFELACETAGVAGKKKVDATRQIAVQVMQVAAMVEKLDGQNRLKLARVLGTEVAGLIPMNAKNDRGLAFLIRLLNHVKTVSVPKE